jgi:hypothetical protein
MITKRCTQLYSAVRALRRLDFRALNKALGVDTRYRPTTTTSKGRKLYWSNSVVARKKSDWAVRVDGSDIKTTMSSLWLEYTFGWVPFFSDMWAAANVLQQDFGRTSHKVVVRDVAYDVYQDGGSFHSYTGEVSMYMKGTLRVTNPNLLLANKLGLVNPAYVLWDAVPFSFVLDWVLPVGKFLQSLSNEYGLEVLNPERGWGARLTGTNGHVEHENKKLFPANGLIGIRSTSGFPRPGLMDRLRLPNVDPWLAVTSVSLLVQQFGRVFR